MDNDNVNIKKKGVLLLGLFFICILIIGLIFFSGMNQATVIRINENKTIVANMPFCLNLYLNIFLLLSAVVATYCMTIYWQLFLKSQKQRSKEKIVKNMLSSDEKKIYEYLLKNKSAIQKDLTYELKFSKAKTSRLLDSLSEKKVIRRVSYGLSNKITLY